MTGTNFVAVRRLTDKEGNVLAEPGQECDRVPEESLGWLLNSGWIKAAEKPVSRSTFRRRARATDEKEE